MPENLTTTNVTRFGAINPATLPPMAVLETISTEVIIAARMQQLLVVWNKYDPPNKAQYDLAQLEFDPIKIEQELNAFFELLVRDRVNQSARAVTLANAVGPDLDAIATRYPYGMPRKPGELDDTYRMRIWLSPNIFSLNGPGQGVYESYVFWALNAPMPAGERPLKHASALTLQGTGNVYIPIISTVPELPGRDQIAALVATNPDQVVIVTGADPSPTSAQISAVYDYITEPAEARQGLTDIVNVSGAKVINTTIDIGVWLFPGIDKATLMNQIVTALVQLAAAMRWIGADLTMLALDGALAQVGVYNVRRNSPTADLIADMQTTINVTKITVTYLGTGE